MRAPYFAVVARNLLYPFAAFGMCFAASAFNLLPAWFETQFASGRSARTKIEIHDILRLVCTVEVHSTPSFVGTHPLHPLHADPLKDAWLLKVYPRAKPPADIRRSCDHGAADDPSRFPDDAFMSMYLAVNKPSLSLSAWERRASFRFVLHSAGGGDLTPTAWFENVHFHLGREDWGYRKWLPLNALRPEAGLVHKNGSLMLSVDIVLHDILPEGTWAASRGGRNDDDHALLHAMLFFASVATFLSAALWWASLPGAGQDRGARAARRITLKPGAGGSSAGPRPPCKDATPLQERGKRTRDGEQAAPADAGADAPEWVRLQQAKRRLEAERAAARHMRRERIHVAEGMLERALGALTAAEVRCARASRKSPEVQARLAEQHACTQMAVDNARDNLEFVLRDNAKEERRLEY